MKDEDTIPEPTAITLLSIFVGLFFPTILTTPPFTITFLPLSVPSKWRSSRLSFLSPNLESIGLRSPNRSGSARPLPSPNLEPKVLWSLPSPNLELKGLWSIPSPNLLRGEPKLDWKSRPKERKPNFGWKKLNDSKERRPNGPNRGSFELKNWRFSRVRFWESCKKRALIELFKIYWKNKSKLLGKLKNFTLLR